MTMDLMRHLLIYRTRSFGSCYRKRHNERLLRDFDLIYLQMGRQTKKKRWLKHTLDLNQEKKKQ